jgi:4-diphosphocytidyl-2-C-methyl-D-erythritol kinase
VSAPAGEANIAWRAASAFREAAGEETSIDVLIQKHVPAGGGLGGGSSDAAATLTLLDEVLPGRVDMAARRAIAARLGADVPFFLTGGVASGRGRGDEITPVERAQPLALVLVLPPLACETAAVYEGFQRGRAAPAGGAGALLDALAVGDAAGVRAAHHNALAFTAMHLQPAFRRFTAEVERRLGRPPAMSGSGSTLFDVPDPDEVEAVCRALAGLPGARRVVRLAGAEAGGGA